MTPYYSDGAVTIYNADCRDVLPTLERVNAVVTSPPYNQLATMPTEGSGLWGETQGGAGFLRAWRDSGYPDAVPEDEYQREQNEIASLIGSACVEDASLFYNHQIRWRDGDCLHPVNWFRPTGWNLRQEIVWNRGGGMMFNARMFVRFDERILWFVKGKWKWNQEAVGWGTVWNIARYQQQQGKEHPVAFPIELPRRCIAATTDPGDLILDPFGGSGTTARAAKDLGRRCIVIEREERWAEVAAKRMAQSVMPLEVGA